MDKSISDEEIIQAYEFTGSTRKAADYLLNRVSKEKVRTVVNRHNVKRPIDKVYETFEFPEPPPEAQPLPISDLIQERVKKFERKRKIKKHKHDLTIKVNSNLPIALALVGDPHLDNDGTDIKRVFEDAHIIRDTDGMFGMNIGDNLDLWPGRLARLYAKTSVTTDDGWRILEEYLDTIPWLAFVMGNHDHFANPHNPFKFITQGKVPVFEPYDVRIKLVFPNGAEFPIWMRHDFAGHSQWNSTHAMAKKHLMGAMFKLYISGHKHNYADQGIYNGNTGIFAHCIRADSYKVFDDYSDQGNYDPSANICCPTVIIDPEAPVRMSSLFESPAQAAPILKSFRESRMQTHGHV